MKFTLRVSEIASRRNPLRRVEADFISPICEADGFRLSASEDFTVSEANNFTKKDDVIEAYGWKRTTYVLANTLQVKSDDGRFHRENIEWSRRIYVPPDREHNDSFAVNSHPAVLDGFIRLYRNRLDSLGLFQSEHCEPNARAELDYTDRVLVLSREVLSEDYWEPKYQLWYAHDGFGCSPHAIGRSIRATCLADGELTRWNRSDFLGPIKDEFLPDWAREQAERLREGQTLVDYEQEPAMQEMTV